ncbi:hypothetical protein M3Y97_00929500 [Aphelenchoides bicaudatus]|nr:hypothetical protein M3Y97_00929500 [Aphelenchoides bicaudatus]
MSPLHIFQFIRIVHQLLLTSLLINSLDGRHIDYLPDSKTLQQEAIQLSDLAITVKTTKKCELADLNFSLNRFCARFDCFFLDHYTRLIDIADTWFEDAAQNTFFVTDEADDPLLNERLGGHLIGTTCSQGHSSQSLKCKMQKELELLAQIDAKWSCHLDDDNFVNIPELLSVLGQYDASKPMYIGRSSMEKPIRFGETSFLFGTGGAGICLSRALLHLIHPYIDSFDHLTSKFFVAPDDVTLGYLINGLLRIPLTNEPSFHSHLHKLDAEQLDTLHKQAILGPKHSIIWRLSPMSSKDKQLFYALHCHNFKQKCARVNQKLLKR